MPRQNRKISIAVLALFFVQILSPIALDFATTINLIDDKKSRTVGFSSGSGHELAGDSISVDGKSWTVRGESILDFWNLESQGIASDKPVDLFVNDDGIGYGCSINGSQINMHTLHLNSSFETLEVETLQGGDVADECAISVAEQHRIQVVYNVGDDLRLARLAEKNVVYQQRTWHLRTIVEDIFSEGLKLEFDSDYKTHILFKDSDMALRHLWFNKAFWNQTVLDEGPVGGDVEVQIDENDWFHVVYTHTSEGELRLLKFNETQEVRQVLARNNTIGEAVGMDLDSNNIEQIVYSNSDGMGNNSISLLRSLVGKDTGRLEPTPKYQIQYDDDSPEGTIVSGDFNGDGKSDIAYSDPVGNGTISIHYGSSAGLNSSVDDMLVGLFSNSNLGTGLAAGDFNCDGFDDLASSEPGNSVNNSGHVSIRLGTSNGIDSNEWWSMNGSEQDFLGWSLTSLGDVESDGCTDLAVVSNKTIVQNDTVPSLSQIGLVMILQGNTTAMIHQANITQSDYGPMFGRQIAAGGDVNGDGYLDMVVSNTGSEDSPTGYSSVEFFHGDSNGINTTAINTFSLAVQGRLYGVSMAFVGDVEGDGYDDIVVSELYADTGLYHSGKVHMWSGSANGSATSWNTKGTFSNALLGSNIAPAGDINEDGFDDFMLVSPTAQKSGRISLYLGSASGPRTDVQTIVQGDAQEYVGVNIISGIDVDGDGMNEILYSERDVSQGDEFAPILSLVSERDWEFVVFDFEEPVVELELFTPLRGTPSIMTILDDNTISMTDFTLDGTPSGRWDTRILGTARDASFGISNSGYPIVLLQSNNEIKTLTVEGHTGLDFTLNTGNQLGKNMDTAIDSNGYLRFGHYTPSFSSIFYTSELSNGFATTTTIVTSVNVVHPIDIFVDSNDDSRLVYVESTGEVHLMTSGSSWTDETISNTSIGYDFDSMWTSDDELIYAQISEVGGIKTLQLVKHNSTNTTFSNITSANLTSEFEVGLVDDNIIVSIIDGGRMKIFESSLAGGNWTEVADSWMLGETSGFSLELSDNVLLFDANNSVQGFMIRNTTGSWNQQSASIPDTNSSIEFLVEGDRWHVTSTNDNNLMVWTTGIVENILSPTTSVIFPVVETSEPIPIESVNGNLMLSYSQTLANSFKTMRMIPDQDKDLIPDIHDDMSTIPNQWKDTDSDGYGDNPDGALPDACVSTFGTSSIEDLGCADFDNDGWSDATDDCANEDGTSWWGRFGCDDVDQDGWSDNGVTFVGGDRYPTNWKQALDSDGDTYGDNHGPDCCDVIVLGELESSTPDVFPYNRKQWEDEDNDGYGDNESDQETGDKCWWVQGFSWRDRLGCVDSDGDGASDPSDFGTFREWTEEDGADWWPEDPTQWADSDLDGFGDNSSDDATLPDKFPSNRYAANDTDHDSYPNNWTSYAYLDDDNDGVINKNDWCENTTSDGDNQGCSADQKNVSSDDYNYRDPSTVIGLFLDNCPKVSGNSTNAMDGSGNLVAYYGCIDSDGDGREDGSDAFPLDETQVADTDGDGWGDNQNGNDPDACPYDAGVINGTKPNGDPGVGCPIVGEESDFDNDGVPDDYDDCNNTEQGHSVDEIGCSEYQKDDDQDGVSNAEDSCPETPITEVADNIGCSDSQRDIDTDGDGITDPYDKCPGTEEGLIIDLDGCALNQLDSDGDGVTDNLDLCPDTEEDMPVLANGCLDETALLEDIDGDGYKGPYTYYPDNGTHVGDAFPLDSSQWEDRDGDGFGDSLSGNNSDFCPDEFGNSTKKGKLGCIDTDGDGYRDIGDDKFPTEPTQWDDNDLDGWGDNPDGRDPDQCPGTSTAGDYTAQARANFGCADYESDSDGDGVTDDIDACMNTEPGVPVYPSGCKMIIEDTTDDDAELIMGMEPMMFYIAAGGGGLFVLLLIGFVVSKLRGGGSDDDWFDDDDDDDYYDDDDDDDDFMSGILGGGQSRGPPRSGRSASGPSRGPPGAGPSRGPPGAGPSSGPSRGPPGAGPSRGPPGAGPSRGPPGASPPSGRPPSGPTMPDPRGPARGKKVSKRKPIGRPAVEIDPNLFSNDEIGDRDAAIDWTKSALKGGESERSILMQLQTTGWSAPQSRAIIELSKR